MTDPREESGREGYVCQIGNPLAGGIHPGEAEQARAAATNEEGLESFELLAVRDHERERDVGTAASSIVHSSGLTGLTDISATAEEQASTSRSVPSDASAIPHTTDPRHHDHGRRRAAWTQRLRRRGGIDISDEALSQSEHNEQEKISASVTEDIESGSHGSEQLIDTSVHIYPAQLEIQPAATQPGEPKLEFNSEQKLPSSPVPSQSIEFARSVYRMSTRRGKKFSQQSALSMCDPELQMAEISEDAQTRKERLTGIRRWLYAEVDDAPPMQQLGDDEDKPQDKEVEELANVKQNVATPLLHNLHTHPSILQKTRNRLRQFHARYEYILDNNKISDDSMDEIEVDILHDGMDTLLQDAEDLNELITEMTVPDAAEHHYGKGKAKRQHAHRRASRTLHEEDDELYSWCDRNIDHTVLECIPKQIRKVSKVIMEHGKATGVTEIRVYGYPGKRAALLIPLSTIVKQITIFVDVCSEKAVWLSSAPRRVRHAATDSTGRDLRELVQAIDGTDLRHRSMLSKEHFSHILLMSRYQVPKKSISPFSDEPPAAWYTQDVPGRLVPMDEDEDTSDGMTAADTRRATQWKGVHTELQAVSPRHGKLPHIQKRHSPQTLQPGTPSSPACAQTQFCPSLLATPNILSPFVASRRPISGAECSGRLAASQISATSHHHQQQQHQQQQQQRQQQSSKQGADSRRIEHSEACWTRQAGKIPGLELLFHHLLDTVRDFYLSTSTPTLILLEHQHTTVRPKVNNQTKLRECKFIYKEFLIFKDLTERMASCQLSCLQSPKYMEYFGLSLHITRQDREGNSLTNSHVKLFEALLKTRRLQVLRVDAMESPAIINGLSLAKLLQFNDWLEWVVISRLCNEELADYVRYCAGDKYRHHPRLAPCLCSSQAQHIGGITGITLANWQLYVYLMGVRDEPRKRPKCLIFYDTLRGMEILVKSMEDLYRYIKDAQKTKNFEEARSAMQTMRRLLLRFKDPDYHAKYSRVRSVMTRPGRTEAPYCRKIRLESIQQENCKEHMILHRIPRELRADFSVKLLPDRAEVYRKKGHKLMTPAKMSVILQNHCYYEEVADDDGCVIQNTAYQN